jgi:glucokinase
VTSDDCVVAVDVGGTTIKAALLDLSCNVVEHLRVPTGRHEGPIPVLDRVLTTVDRLVSVGASVGRPAVAVGIACLGAVDEEGGIALDSGNVGWRDLPLRRIVTDRTDLPVTLENDIRAGARAELCGPLAGLSPLLYVALGTGVGAAVSVNGALLRGAHHLAGELGHVVVDPAGRSCVCGARGCLEAEASGPAVEARYATATNQQRVAAAEVLARCRNGDPVARAVWDTTADCLARGLAAAVAVLDPAAIVVGGGVALAGPDLFEPLRSALRRHYRLGKPPPVMPARHTDASACLGAGLAAWELVQREVVWS